MLAEIILKLAEFENEEEHPYSPRASMAGPERCIRSMVYHGLNIERKPLPGRALHVFSDSSWHEQLTDDWLRKSAYRLHSEQMHIEVNAGLSFLPARTCMALIGDKPCGREIPAGYIAGHLDGIVTDMMGTDYLYEHKAFSTFTVKRYWRKEELPLDNFTQCALYLRGLHEDNPDLKKGLLLIKDKNVSAFIEYQIEYDYKTDAAFIPQKVDSYGETVKIGESIEHICGAAFDKFDAVADYIAKKTLPSRPYDRDHWRCEYCGWGETCWEGWESEIEQMKLGGMFPNEVADMLRYYKELGGQGSSMEKEKKEIRGKILNLMKQAGYREGEAGEYTAAIVLNHVAESHHPARTEERLVIKKKIAAQEKEG